MHGTDHVDGRSGTTLRKPFWPEGQPLLAEPQQNQGPANGFQLSPGRGLVVDRTCSVAAGAARGVSSKQEAWETTAAGVGHTPYTAQTKWPRLPPHRERRWG